MLNIAILGFGFVGSGVADVFAGNADIISERLGAAVNIKYVLDIKELDGPFEQRRVTDMGVILEDASVRLVVETLVGSHPAYEFTKAALERGVSVVSSNKAVVADYGAELLAIAGRTGARYFFEGSVGGGTPVIMPVYNSLAANKISGITAILNATTNFILTKMTCESLSFGDALKIAQDLGYAERDPSSDVQGLDTCRKICILSSLAFGRHLPPGRVHTEGVTGITPEDIKNAAKLGCRIKLVARAERLDGGEVRVVAAPMLVGADSPLYGVDDINNAVILTCDMLGDAMFYGPGAGRLQTASALAADAIDALTGGSKNISWEPSDGSFARGYDDQARYIRAGLGAHDFNAAFKLIKAAFPDAGIHEAGDSREIFFTTASFAQDWPGGLEIRSSIRIL